jgi:hypothetical protein
MKNEQPAASARLYSPRATLCAIGLKLRSLKLFETIAGAHGLAEINTRVRSDAALQRAFGRESCAEQSVVRETLDACDVENVRQMKHAFKSLTRAHGRAYRHPYQARLQLLDVDMTGLPCGRRAEKAGKGYFANQPGRYGRQMARVVATRYEVVVLDWVGPGNVQLNKVLRPLVEETEWMLDLDAGKRARTVLRIDAGGGSINDVNWLLRRGYQIHSKDVSSQRAAGIAPTVKEWFSDPLHPGRQVGWATCPATATSATCIASSCGGARRTGGSASPPCSRR